MPALRSLSQATITKRIDVTSELWRIWLELDEPLPFKPGQYCTIGAGGIERPYSIVSAPHESLLELFIELVPPPEGNLTPVLHGLEVGSRVSIRPRAKGLFTLNRSYRNHLMIATVTGIVPYVSMLRDYLHAGELENVFYVLHGASYSDEFTYDGELSHLANEHSNLIKYVPTISRPADPRNSGWQGATGRVNTLLERFVDELSLSPEATLVYACGHPGMIEDVRLRSTRIGFKVQEERFWVDDDDGTD